MAFRPILALAISPFLLAGCGEKEDASQKGAALLRAYYADRPLEFGWEVVRVERVSDTEVRIDVLVEDDGVIGQLRTRSRMDQMGIARMACPDPDAPFVKSIDRDVKFAVALVTREAALVRSACKR